MSWSYGGDYGCYNDDNDCDNDHSNNSVSQISQQWSDINAVSCSYGGVMMMINIMIIMHSNNSMSQISQQWFIVVIMVVIMIIMIMIMKMAIVIIATSITNAADADEGGRGGGHHLHHHHRKTRELLGQRILRLQSCLNREYWAHKAFGTENS